MPRSLPHISWRFSTWLVITLSNTTDVVLLTDFNSHIDDRSCISDPVSWPPLLQWSCPLPPSVTKLPVIPIRGLSCTWKFSINSISNNPFSTVTTCFSSSLSLVYQLQQFFNSSRIYYTIHWSYTFVLYLCLSLLSLPHFLIKLKFHDQSHCLIPFSSLAPYLPAENPNPGNIQLFTYIHEAKCD